MCPAKNVICNYCSKIGHLNVVYKLSKVHEVQPDEIPENRTFLGAVFKGRASAKDWTVDVCVYNTKIKFKVDTGADAEIVSKDIYKKYISTTSICFPVTKISGVQTKSP